MYQLYIANKTYSSWSLRPWVLLRALGIAFEETLVPFASDDNFEAFRRFSPSGRVPCLVDGDTVVWDSLAIAEYLAERHAGVWPVDPAARAWARCAAAEMHSGFGTLRTICSMICGLRVQLHSIPAPLQRDVSRIGELWNEGLGRFGGPFLAGREFTAVDAFYAPVAFRVQTYDLDIDGPAASYWKRLVELGPMREWYAAALTETWREAAHDADARRYGTITTDLRAGAM